MFSGLLMKDYIYLHIINMHPIKMLYQLKKLKINQTKEN